MKSFCGKKGAFTWTSRGSIVAMIFKSDSSSTSSGFYGYFSTVGKGKQILEHLGFFIFQVICDNFRIVNYSKSTLKRVAMPYFKKHKHSLYHCGLSIFLQHFPT